MILLRLKSALIPPKDGIIRHEDNEAQLDDLKFQMTSAARLVPDALELLHRIELACCIPRHYKVKFSLSQNRALLIKKLW